MVRSVLDFKHAPMLISVYGDSLALPRVSEKVGYFNTYSELARSRLQLSLGRIVCVFNRSLPGREINALFRQYLSDESYLAPNDHDIVLIQCGVVDCAPRPLPERARRLLGMMPTKIQQPIVKMLHNNRSRILSSGLIWRLTEPKDYHDIITRWVEHAADRFRLVIVVEIAPVTTQIDKHSPGFMKSVTEYNSIIADAVATSKQNVVCLKIAEAIHSRNRRMKTYMTESDGHHLTAKGHELYGRLLALIIRRFFVSNHSSNSRVSNVAHTST